MLIPLSVIILTKNEKTVIARCINSIKWADEVLVIDSGSTDKTREIAVSLGANVYEQEWLGWPRQRNKGVLLAKNDWVFFVEADEIVSAELAQSIQQAFASIVDERSGYSVDRRGDFLGVLLPNQARASKPLVRIFNRKKSSYDQDMLVHEEVRFPGQLIRLQGVLLHWRGYSMNEYFPLFNRYATIEAQVLHEAGKRATALSLLSRPVLRFGWSYLIKGGWRLGMRGLIQAMLKACSEYMRYAKLWELQNIVGSTPHPPVTIYEPQADESEATVPLSLQGNTAPSNSVHNAPHRVK